MYHVFEVEESDLPVTRFNGLGRVGIINSNHAIVNDEETFYFIIAGTKIDRFCTKEGAELSTIVKKNSDYVSDSEAYSFKDRTETICKTISLYKRINGEYPKVTNTLLKELLEDFFTRYGFTGWAERAWDKQLKKLLQEMDRSAYEFIEQEKIDAFLKKLIDMNAIRRYKDMTKGKNSMIGLITDEVKDYHDAAQKELGAVIKDVKERTRKLAESEFSFELDSQRRPIRRYSFTLDSKKFGNYEVELLFDGIGRFLITINLENFSKKATGLVFEETSCYWLEIHIYSYNSRDWWVPKTDI